MKQVLFRQGRAEIGNVPVPLVEPGTVLVRVSHSCISAGTELAGIRASGTPLWMRAVRQPAKALDVVRHALGNGVVPTIQRIRGAAAADQAVGYSAAGTVVDIGEGVVDLPPGRLVACAGAQAAHHAEYIRVPRNLVVPLPAEVNTRQGCTVTLGAIALQGVRRAETTLGETFVVAGLGALGQLVCQILKASGCSVVGLDRDPRRVEVARNCGIDLAFDASGREADVEQIARLTDGTGADGVIVTASTTSDEVISAAFQMCRRKGRVVLVGDVGLNLNRSDMYEKELDLRVSTSYGPGRYDRRYEEDGCDYPISHVRWTENRNMSAFARLLATGAVDVSMLIEREFEVQEAARAYELLSTEQARPLMVVLSYPGEDPAEQSRNTVRMEAAASLSRPAAGKAANKLPSRPLRLGVIGAGAFARSAHLPNIRASREIELRGIATSRGHTAASVAREFNAHYATTSVERILEDDSIDAVLIATRHHLHANLVLRALQAGRHVLVEKPLALNTDELAAVANFYRHHSHQNLPLLQTGFNRRFSPHIAWIADRLSDRAAPLVINYCMNAGYLPGDHWVHGAEGGGRNIGEACHIYDLFNHLTGASPVDVTARAMRPRAGYYSSTDNFTATVTFDDGSLATLTYTACGNASFPKERMDVFSDGRVFSLIDYLTTEEFSRRHDRLKTPVMEKGHREELSRFTQAVQGHNVWPIPLESQLAATEISFAIEHQLKHLKPAFMRSSQPEVARAAG